MENSRFMLSGLANLYYSLYTLSTVYSVAWEGYTTMGSGYNGYKRVQGMLPTDFPPNLLLYSVDKRGGLYT